MAKLNDAAAIYLGSTAASAVYAGATKVWPTAVALPIEIDASGWTATALDDPAALVGEVLSVKRAGFDGAGLPTTFTEALTIPARLRRPYPNQAAPSANTMVLPEFVYDGDVISGVTNKSARKSPPPQFAWLHHDHEIVDAPSVTMRAFVAHAHPRNGRPVAAIRVTIADGSGNGVSLVTSIMVPVTYAASGLTVPAFEATLDISGLDDGELTVDATVYPWIGDAFTLSEAGLPLGDMRLCPMTLWKVGVTPRTYAYVATDGNNGTGVASTDPVAARAAPFATTLAAGNAIASAAGSASWGVVRFRAGSYVRGKVNLSTPTAPMIWEAEAGEVVTIGDGGANVTNNIPTRLICRGIILQKQGSGIRILDGNNSKVVADRNVLALVNCDFDVADQAPSNTWIGKTMRIWVINSKNSNGLCLDLTAFSTDAKTAAVIGSEVRVGNTAVVIIASRATTWSVPKEGSANSTLAGPGALAAFSEFSERSSSSAVVVTYSPVDNDPSDYGFGVIGCGIERMVGTAVCLYAAADGHTTRAVNFNAQQTSIRATSDTARFNRLYNDDVASPAAEKWGSLRFVVSGQWACKTDVFAMDGSMTGNWPAVMHVGSGYSTMTSGSTQANSHPGAGSWRREIEFPGIQMAMVLNDVWTDADFRPNPAGGLQTIPGHLVAYPFDLYGQPIPTDGTALVGAAQAAP